MTVHRRTAAWRTALAAAAVAALAALGGALVAAGVVGAGLVPVLDLHLVVLHATSRRIYKVSSMIACW